MGAPGGGGGGTFEWKTYEAPAELTMTYGEFLAQTGLPRAGIPDAFLFSDDGTAARHTKNQWYQFQRLYGGEGGAGAAKAIEGKVGRKLARVHDPMFAYFNSAITALIDAYMDGSDLFSFTILQPRPVPSNMVDDMFTGRLSRATVDIAVIMKVKPSARQYPESVYRQLRKYDCLGWGGQSGNEIINTAEPFRIITAKGGFYHPRIINLFPNASGLWDTLWSGNQVRLTLYNPKGQVIATPQSQPAGHTGAVLAKLVYPDRIYWQPRYRLLTWPFGFDFHGRRVNLDNAQGWIYNFVFELSRDEISAIHTAKAEYVQPKQDIEAIRRAFRPPVFPGVGAGSAPSGATPGAGPEGAPPAGPGAMPAPPGAGAPPGGAPPPPPGP